MSNFLPTGNRLKEERERLGLNQTDFAALGGAGRKTQFNYESGERSPDGAYLAAIAAAGADVLYILTGARSNAAPALRIEQQQAGYSVDVLSKQEQALLDNYRHSPPDGQAAIKATSAAFAQSKQVKKGKAA